MPVAFIHELSFADLPVEVVRQAKHCLLDLVGVAASGRRTELSRITHQFAVRPDGNERRGRAPALRRKTGEPDGRGLCRRLHHRCLRCP